MLRPRVEHMTLHKRIDVAAEVREFISTESGNFGGEIERYGIELAQCISIQLMALLRASLWRISCTETR